MNQKMELIYKSPHSIKTPEGAVKYLEINGFQGIREYIIKSNLNLDTIGGKNSYLILRINKDSLADSYSSIEHIYGRMEGKTVHISNSRPGGIRGGLFMGRTHANKRSAINIESKIYFRVAIGSIAIILVLTGVIMAGYNIRSLFTNLEHWIYINWFLLPGNKHNSKDIDTWLDKEPKTNTTKTETPINTPIDTFPTSKPPASLS